jgi:hypothetical protein
MDIVKRAVVYAPTAINPACPREKSPVNPFIRFILKPSIVYMAQRFKILSLKASNLPLAYIRNKINSIIAVIDNIVFLFEFVYIFFIATPSPIFFLP